MKKVALYLFTCTLVLLFVLYFKIDVTYSDYKDSALVLLNVSSMVFTLMGIWIAFLYPNALKRIVDPNRIENVDFSDSLSETKRLESIVGSVLKSAVVVIAIMFIFSLKMIVSSLDIYLEHHALWKAVAVTVLFLLSVLQLESVFHVAKSNVMFINDLHSKREDREADSDI